MLSTRNKLIILFLIFVTFGISQAQFLDSFNKNKIDGWFFFTGDGNATMDFIQKDGYARILVDATRDKHNVWWAIIKKDISSYLDLSKLQDPSFELRVEAKVRLSEAPRRINFMINTQRTINFHKHLMEYDIADTSQWHIISMTTNDLDVVPGDSLYVQLGVTDWGPGKYYVDLDYYRADIINVNHAQADKGEPLPYHPPLPDIDTLSEHLNVAHDALINSDFPDVNFNNWHVKEQNGNAHILTINANQWAILRWDFGQYKNMKTTTAGVLELTTQSVLKGGDYIKKFGEDLGIEFGKVRIIEILSGDTMWDQENVTFNNFTQGNSIENVINSQMIFDSEISEDNGSKNYITLSRPVLQRMLDGKTKGLLIRPLGAINTSFYASENQSGKDGPKLHFNIRQ